MYHINKLTYIFIMLLISGCYISENIKTKEQFDGGAENGDISILTKDTTKYFLYKPTLIDSIIRGRGRMEKNNVSKDFNGEIRLADVVYIQSEDISFWGGIAAASAIGFLGLTAIAILGDNEEGISAKVEYPNRGGGGSCPFVYSKTGSEYTLEGEAIPASLCSKLETETTNLLAHLTPGNNEINLRVSNERPETHYINSIRLLKYNYEPGYKLLADENNLVWPAANEVSPLSAEDNNQRSILSEINTADENYWESDLTTASVSQDFTDKLVITFPKDNLQSSALLIIKAINTKISDVLFRKMYDFLGDEVLDFVYDAENNPEVLSSLQKWINEASLKAYVWDGNQWEYKGKIYAEATFTPFERVIKVDLTGINTSDLVIKLEFMTDVWKIDKTAMSSVYAGPLQSEEVPLIRADLSGSDAGGKISMRDGKYQVLLPGDKIDLKFWDKEPAQNTHYFLNISGYIYEWYVKDSRTGNNFLSFIPQSSSRNELLKNILKYKELLLPPVYDEWEKVRQ